MLETQIGGAYVRRPFTMGGKVFDTKSKPLSRDELLAIPRSNRRALIDQGKLELFPASPGMASTATATEKFAIHRGGGAWDVIEGVRLNKDALTKEEAVALAGTSPGNA